MDEAEQWFQRGNELADAGGAAAEEGQTLLRAAVAAGHGPARLRLAEFLLYQVADTAESYAEAWRLLGEAVADNVPGAWNMLGITFLDDGALADAETCLRAAVTCEDPNARVNLAVVLHARSADREAFAVLRDAAEHGDGIAYWIVMRLLPPRSHTASAVTAAYESNSLPEERPVCVLMSADAWRFDPSVLPTD